MSFVPVLLTAQVQNGQFTGVVTDPSGAAIPNAKVTVTNTGTNLAITTSTNQSGLFVARELPPGTYKIKPVIQFFLRLLAVVRRITVFPLYGSNGSYFSA